MKLLLFSSVCDQVFDNLPVHQRLPAKEINFQIPSCSGIGDQKIQGFLTNFISHKRSSSVILSFFCKTVFAGKIAVVCDMQAECLHNRLTLDNLPDKRFICINNKKLSVCSQLCHIIQYISEFFFGIFPFQLIFQLVPCTFFFQRLHCLILVHTVQTCNNFVPRLVHYMNASAVDIKYNIISIVLVLMNHNRYPFLSLFFKFFLIRQMTAALKPLPACHTYSLHLQISLICCVRKSDFLLYKKSCMLTDRMSGILRIRPSLLYCSESVYSMF